jgi:hypothetical protein
MDRTDLLRVFVTMLCLALVAPPAFAKPVQHGAMDICEVIDGGTVIVVDGTEVCCAREILFQDDVATVRGNFRCVQCDPPGSDNCEEWNASKAPPDRVVTLLLTSVLAQQREMRTELNNLSATILKFCPMPPANK